MSRMLLWLRARLTAKPYGPNRGRRKRPRKSRVADVAGVAAADLSFSGG